MLVRPTGDRRPATARPVTPEDVRSLVAEKAPERLEALDRYQSAARRYNPTRGWMRQTLRLIDLPFYGDDKELMRRLGIGESSRLKTETKNDQDGRDAGAKE